MLKRFVKIRFCISVNAAHIFVVLTATACSAAHLSIPLMYRVITKRKIQGEFFASKDASSAFSAFQLLAFHAVECVQLVLQLLYISLFVSVTALNYYVCNNNSPYYGASKFWILNFVVQVSIDFCLTYNCVPTTRAVRSISFGQVGSGMQYIP